MDQGKEGSSSEEDDSRQDGVHSSVSSAIPSPHRHSMTSEKLSPKFCLYHRKREVWASVYPSVTGLSGAACCKLDEVPSLLRSIDWENQPYAYEWSGRPIQYFTSINDVDWLVKNVLRLDKNPFAVYWIYSGRIPEVKPRVRVTSDHSSS